MSKQEPEGVLSDASQLTADHFEPLVSSVFVVTAIQSETSETHSDPVPECSETEIAEASNAELTLVQVIRHAQHEAEVGLRREQFSLLFSANTELMNACLPISHPELGNGSLLLSRVAGPLDGDQSANWYEAVFG